MENELPEDFDEAIDIINDLIEGLGFMPTCWDELYGLEVSDRVKAFMQKHDPERWGSEEPEVNSSL